MPLKVTSTRYSLVKGERIVRFVLNTRLRITVPIISLLSAAACQLIGLRHFYLKCFLANKYPPDLLLEGNSVSGLDFEY
ncbi:hypothetical protein CR513_23852, partial [Mucuna pruriens]